MAAAGEHAALQGRLVLWCRSCGRWFVCDGEAFDWTCPRCGTFLAVMKCYRCGHEWRPMRSYDRLPRVCPVCKSPYWDRERLRVQPAQVQEEAGAVGSDAGGGEGGDGL